MQLFALIVAIFSTLTLSFVDGVTCGGSLTSDCLGDSDIHYDPDVSNAAVDQAPIWMQFQGGWEPGPKNRLGRWF
jgi:hypothetical protein